MKVMTDQKNKSEQPSLIGGVIVTHGHLASEFIVTPASIDWHDDVDVARAELQRAITRVSRSRGVLLLTDMFGGTPTDIASMFLDNPKIEVVTGVNLPMILKLADQTETESLTELSRRVREAGHEGIHVAGELLSPTSKS